MVLGEPVGSLLRYSINMLLVLENFNSFGTWGGFLVGVSLGPLAGLMVFTVEVSLVVLSLGLPHGCPLDSPNNGSDLPVMLLIKPLGLWFGSDVFWVLDIYCVPPSGYLITSSMNSVFYFQLMELLNLSFFPTWMIPTS